MVKSYEQERYVHTMCSLQGSGIELSNTLIWCVPKLYA